METQNEPQPIGEVLRGIELRPLAEGVTPMDVFVLVKGEDSGGRISWAFRTTDGLSIEELIGALVVQVKFQRDAAIEAIRSYEGEHDSEAS